MRVGVLGGGQLGRMLALAGYPLGLRMRFMDNDTAPAGDLAELVTGEFTDPAALEAFATGLDVVTYEFENVPVQAATWLAERVPVYPPPLALDAAQDRLNEKMLFARLGIPTPRFAAVETRDDLTAAVAQIGLPAVLKTRRLGYDGKGQMVLREAGDVEEAWRALAGRALILEAFVQFEEELSIIAVRGYGGETAFYPLTRNEHRRGILRESVAPVPGLAPGLQSKAEDLAGRILAAIDYVGVLALELFHSGGELLANEVAPRVHNSGHWTIEGAVCSQFENHLRAILALPLGSTAPRGEAAMLNLIGALPALPQLLAVSGAHIHLYGKTPRPGRKIGHVTVCEETPSQRDAVLDQLREIVGGSDPE